MYYREITTSIKEQYGANDPLFPDKKPSFGGAVLVKEKLVCTMVEGRWVLLSCQLGGSRV